MAFLAGTGLNAMLSGMNVLHCPLCIGLAVLSITRAAAHLLLGWRMLGIAA